MGKQNNGDEKLKAIVSKAIKLGKSDDDIRSIIKGYKTREAATTEALKKKEAKVSSTGLPDAPIQTQPPAQPVQAQANPAQVNLPPTDSESLSASAPQLPLSASPSVKSKEELAREDMTNRYNDVMTPGSPAIKSDPLSIQQNTSIPTPDYSKAPDRSAFLNSGTKLSEDAKAKGVKISPLDAQIVQTEAALAGREYPIDLSKALAPEEISKPYDEIMASLQKDLFSPDKSNFQKNYIEPEEVDYFLNKKADETFPEDPEKRNKLYSMLQKGAYGRDYKENKTDKEGVFFDNKELYRKNARLDFGLQMFKQDYGEGSEELLLTSYFAVVEDTDFNDAKGRKKTSTFINVNEAPSLSEQTLRNIFDKGMFGTIPSNLTLTKKSFEEASSSTAGQFKDSAYQTPDQNTDLANLTFDEFKDLWANGEASYINPYGAQGSLSGKADEMFAEALKANVQSTIDRHAQGDTVGGSVPTELLRLGKGGYEGVKEYVKKKDGNYGLSLAEMSISKSYSELKGVNEDMSQIEKNIKDTQNWLQIKSTSEDPLSFDEQTKLKVNIKNYEQELKKLEGVYSNYDKAISDKKKALLGVDSNLPEFKNPDPLKSEQWNSDFDSLKKYYTKGYEGSLEDARVTTSYEIDALQDAVLLRDDLSRYHNTIRKGGHIFNVDYFDSEDPLIRELTDSRVELMAINKVLSTKIDPKDRPRGYGSYVSSLATGFLSSVGAETITRVTEENMVKEFVQAASDNGIKITSEQLARAKETTGQQVAGGIGSTIVPMAQLAATSIAMAATGGTAVVAGSYNLLKTVSFVKNSKVAMGLVGFAETATQQGIAFSIAGQGAATGVGEGLGGEAFNVAIKNSPLGKLAGGLGVKFLNKIAGAGGEFIGEYAGEFMDELSKNDIGKAWANTIGDDPFQKALVTYNVCLMLSVGAGAGKVEVGKAMANMDEYVLSQDPVTQEIKNAQRAVYESNEQEIPDSLKTEAELDTGKVGEEYEFNLDRLNENVNKLEELEAQKALKPTVTTDTEVEGMEIKNPDGGFYSKEALAEMVEASDPLLADITITNPTPEVQTLLEKKKAEPAEIEGETASVPEPIIETESTTKETKGPETSEEVVVEPTEEGEVAAKEAYRAAMKDVVFGQKPNKSKLTEAIKMMKEQGLDPSEVDSEIVEMLMEEGLTESSSRAMTEDYREMNSPVENTKDGQETSKTASKTEPAKESKTQKTETPEVTVGKEPAKVAETTPVEPINAEAKTEQTTTESKGPETETEGPKVKSIDPTFKPKKGKSSQTMRFAEKIEDGTFKDEAEAIASYDTTTQDGLTEMANDVIANLGERGAINAVSTTDGTPEGIIRRRVIMSKAGAMLNEKAKKIIENPKSTPKEIEAAKGMRIDALNAINTSSQEGTATGVANAYMARLYKDHPETYMAAQMRLLDAGNRLHKSYSDGSTLKEAINDTREGIKADLAKMIDENLSDETLVEIITKASAMLSDGSVKTKKDRVSLGKAKVKAGLAAFKKKGTTLNSGLDSDKINAVAQIVAGFIQMGAGKASTIINKTYDAIKAVWDGDITKGHIEVIAESNLDYNALVEKNKRDKKVKKLAELEKQLADLVDRKETESKKRNTNEDSDIKELQDKITRERRIIRLEKTLESLLDGILPEKREAAMESDPVIADLKAKIKRERTVLALQEKIEQAKQGITPEKREKTTNEDSEIQNLREELSEAREILRLGNVIENLKKGILPEKTGKTKTDSTKVASLKEEITEYSKLIKLKEKLSELKKGNLNESRKTKKEDSKEVSDLKDEIKSVEKTLKLEKELSDVKAGKESLPSSKSKEVSAEIEALREEIKQEKVITPEALRKIAKMHLQGQIKEARSLAEAIVSRTNLSEAEAEVYAKQIEEAIAGKVETLVSNKIKAFIKSANKATKKELDDKLESSEDLTDEEIESLRKYKEDSLTRSETSRIARLVNEGALGYDSAFTEAFERRFGFKDIPDKIKERVNDIVSSVNDLNEASQRTIEVDGEVVQINTTFRDEINALNKEFNTLLESTKPFVAAKVMKEILSASYIAMLSGPMTFARAGTGGFSSAIIDSFAFIVFKPRHWGTFMKELLRATPSAWKRGIISRKTGIDYFGRNSMKGLVGEQGMGGQSAGSFETTMLRGLGKAIKEGRMSDAALKTVGQTIKGIHALGALDAFANTLAGAAVGGVMKKKAMLKAGASKSDFRRIMDADYKAVAEQDFEMFKESISNEVDLRIKQGRIKQENRGKEIDSLMKERIGVTGNIRSAKSFYVTNRAQEIKENQLGEKLNSAITLSKEASLMGQPDAIAGIMADKFQKSTAIKDKSDASSAFVNLLFGMNFRFVRLSAQAFNKSLYSVPVLGILPILVGKGWNPTTEQYSSGYGLNKYRANPELAKLRVTKNLIGSVLALALLAEMFDFGDDDDDAYTRMKNFLSGPGHWSLDPDRMIDIQSFGHRGMAGYKNNRDSSFGWKNLSISVTKDAKGNFVRDSYISTRLNPEIAGVIASVGTFSDDAKGYNNTSENQGVRNMIRSTFGYTPTFFGNNLKVATEGSFSSVGRLLKVFMAEEDAAAGSGAVAKEMITSSVGVLNPAAWAFATKEIQASQNKGRSSSKGWSAAVRNAYGLDLLLAEDMTDPFGHTIPEISEFESYNPAEAHPKTIGLQYKFPGHGIPINKKDFSFLTTSKDLTGMRMGTKGGAWASTDDALAKEAKDYQEALFDKTMIKLNKKLESLETKDLLDKMITKIQKESYDQTKIYIYKKYKDTDKLKLIEQKSSN
jgi:hypothetical protein